jgi:hypothetical protein
MGAQKKNKKMKSWENLRKSIKNCSKKSPGKVHIKHEPFIKYFSGLSAAMKCGGVCFEYGNDGA